MRWTLILLAVALCGCEAKIQISNGSTNTAAAAREHDTFAFEKDTNTWLRAFEIWACDDGTFEVKTPLALRGKFETLDQAKFERYLWAVEMAEMAKAGMLDVQGFRRIPDCGKRITP